MEHRICIQFDTPYFLLLRDRHKTESHLHLATHDLHRFREKRPGQEPNRMGPTGANAIQG